MTGSMPLAAVLTLSLLTACAVSRPPARVQGQSSVWVCHGGRNPKWQRVASPAADAHRRHGDAVSTEPQREGAGCR